jgi:DNA-binding transcriptional LysR family regulator
VLGEFKARYPGVVPRLFVANSEAVQDRVAERALDLGFIEGESHLPSLVTDMICDDELQVVCAPSHPLARQKSIAPRTLTEHAYISREPGSGTREVIDHYLQKAGVAPDTMQVVMELGSPEALKGLVATGLGFAIMSRATVAKETQLGQLVQVPLAPRLIRQLAVVYPKERFHSRLVSGFVQFAKERLAALQSANAVRPAA